MQPSDTDKRKHLPPPRVSDELSRSPLAFDARAAFLHRLIDSTGAAHSESSRRARARRPTLVAQPQQQLDRRQKAGASPIRLGRPPFSTEILAQCPDARFTTTRDRAIKKRSLERTCLFATSETRRKHLSNQTKCFKQANHRSSTWHPSWMISSNSATMRMMFSSASLPLLSTE